MRFTAQRPTLKISTDREPCVRPLGIDVIAVTACWTLINGQFGEVAPTTGRPEPSRALLPYASAGSVEEEEQIGRARVESSVTRPLRIMSSKSLRETPVLAHVLFFVLAGVLPGLEVVGDENSEPLAAHASPGGDCPGGTAGEPAARVSSASSRHASSAGSRRWSPPLLVVGLSLGLSSAPFKLPPLFPLPS